MRRFWQSRRVTEAAGEAAVKVLNVLALSPEPKNVTQLARRTGVNGGKILYALKVLYREGLVQSTSGKWSQVAAGTDRDSYSITDKGRQRFRR